MAAAAALIKFRFNFVGIPHIIDIPSISTIFFMNNLRDCLQSLESLFIPTIKQSSPIYIERKYLIIRSKLYIFPPCCTSCYIFIIPLYGLRA
jgi:hypothetical protein